MKLFLDEPESEVAWALFGAATELFAASVGYIEARSALGAARRAGRLSGARSDAARTELEDIWREVHVIDLHDDVLARAGDAAELLKLRAGDAIHLTSALALDDPQLVFATWDRELGQVAREAGLAVAP